MKSGSRWLFFGAVTAFAILFGWNAQKALAATITWDGGGSTASWSEGANWSGDVVPGSSDVALFDTTSTKDATVDSSFSGSVLGLKTDLGYTGVITLARSLDIGSSGMELIDGSFDQGNFAISVSGSLTTGTGEWKTVTGGAAFSCGIDIHDRLYCWGLNTNGQLGDGTTTERVVPTQISGGGTWKQVTAGDAFACAIDSLDYLYCWGLNTNGQLGDGTTAQKNVPTAVSGGMTWKSVDAGASHVCALDSTDHVYCWGLNTNGRLGDGTTTQRTSPTAVASTDTWLSVSAGGSHTCGILSDSSLSCWGLNTSGQLGDGTTTQHLTPTPVSTTDSWQRVALGNVHTCALNTSGGVFCWGAGSQGRLGTGNNTQQNTPTALVIGGTWENITSGAGHSCAINAAGEMYCWGVGTFGQIGDGTSIIVFNLSFATPTKVAKEHVWTKAAGAGSHTCGITDEHLLYCWGLNTTGQLGNGEDASLMTNTTTPTAVSTTLTWDAIATGMTHSCALHGTDLYCWGGSGTGEIGDGFHTQRLFPTEVRHDAGWQAVATGNLHSCAIDGDGMLYCWGFNGFGNLGDGTTTDRISPTLLGGGFSSATWKSVATNVYAGNFGGSTCAIDSTDHLYCWGRNNFGQLGDGTTTQRNVPTEIAGSGAWKHVSVGGTHTCAIDAADELYCWGSNTAGQLGDGTTTQKIVPTLVSGGDTWKNVSAGTGFTCAINVDDNVYCWGDNAFGKLGDASGVQQVVPVEISGSGTWTSVSAGDQHACALDTSGTLYCWGLNANGQLGDGTVTSRNIPTAVSGGDTWIKFDAGYRQTCALNTSNTAYCWGDNSIGELGIDEASHYAFPRDLVTNSGASYSADASALTVSGALNIFGGNFTAPTGTTTVSGDFVVARAASFAANGGAVTLDGANQRVFGSSLAFADFAKSVSAADTVSFESERTYTFTGHLTLQGADGTPLALRSSVADERVIFNAEGARTLHYLDVQDNGSIHATDMSCSLSCVDSGDNKRWSFVPDTMSPLVGDAGAMSAASSATDAIDLNWQKATDDKSDSSTLQYGIYYAPAQTDFSSIAAVQANGTRFTTLVNADHVTVTGLTPGTAYIFGVLVADEANNISAYEPIVLSTQALPATVVPRARLHIVGDLACTVTPDIMLQIDGKNIADFMISEDETFAGAAWTSFVPNIFGTHPNQPNIQTMQLPFTLSLGTKAHTIYLQTRSADGILGHVKKVKIKLMRPNKCSNGQIVM